MQGVEKKGSVPPDRDIVTTKEERGNMEKVEQKHLEKGKFTTSMNSAPARAAGKRQELRQGGWPADGRGAEAEAQARGDAEDPRGPGDQEEEADHGGARRSSRNIRVRGR